MSSASHASPGRRARAAGAIAASLLISIGGPARPAEAHERQSGEPSAASTGSTGGPTVRSITPWVRAGQTWSAVFEPVGLDARGFVEVAIHRATRGTDVAVASRFDRQVDGRDLGSVLETIPARRLLELARPDGSVVVDLSILDPSSDGGPNAIRLPEPGIYPVEVRFTDVDGEDLAQRLLYLVFDRDERPADTEPPTPGGRTTTTEVADRQDPSPAVRAVVVVRVETESPFDDQGSPRLDVARQAARRALDVLGSADTAGICTLIRAEVLEALASSPDINDQTLLNQLVESLRATRALRTPWAPVHIDAWVTQAGTGEIARSMVAAQDTARALGRQILDPRVWPPDDTLDNSSLSGLQRLGVEQVLVDAERLGSARLPRSERGFSRPIRVGSGASTMPAMVADADIAALLRADDDPALIVNRAVARLAAQSLAIDHQRSPRGVSNSRAALVMLDGRVPVEVARTFVAAVSPHGGPIRVTPPEELFATVTPLRSNADGTGTVITRSLRPASAVGGLRELIEALPRAWARGEAARRMRPVQDRVGTNLRVALLGTTRTDQSAAQRRAGLDRAAEATDETLGAVALPSRRTVTVTSRSATIPLRVTNRSDVALRVRVRFASTRLEFEGGNERDLMLEPGVTRLAVPVRVRSSGEFVLRVSLSSPTDGPPVDSGSGIVLQSSTVTVRSTAFSGVGLILSGGALLVLVLWWGRTLRRDRRERLPEESTPDH